MNLSLIPFVKYNATGNDFVVIDNRKHIIPEKQIKSFTQSICQLKFGIGADGVLLLEKSKNADFKMRIINADGSEPEMCGNGSRAMAHFAYLLKLIKKNTCFETLAGTINAEVKPKNIVKVKLIEPSGLRLNLKLKYRNKIITMHFINTSVPHVVVFVNNIEREHVFEIGRYIRYHRLFQPKGTNVNFVQIVNNQHIKVRTYERGVENETLACGTGSTASAIISSFIHSIKSPVKVTTCGKDILKIYFDRYDDYIENVYLEGQVIPVFSGTTRYDGKRLIVI